MSTLQTLLRCVCRLQWRLYLSLVARALLPTIYSSLRLSLLGDLPSDQGVNIASQVLTFALVLGYPDFGSYVPTVSTFGPAKNLEIYLTFSNKSFIT